MSAAVLIDAMPIAMLFAGQTSSGRAYRGCIASAHVHRVPNVLARRGMRWISALPKARPSVSRLLTCVGRGIILTVLVAPIAL
jgi:hypothetical protein